MDQLEVFKPTIENRIKEKIGDSTTPAGLDTYSKCMQSTLFTGITTFTLGFTALYYCQKLLGYQQKAAYSWKFAGLLSALGASLFAYKSTINYAKACEDKYLASIQHRGDSLLQKIKNELDFRRRNVN